MSDELNRAETDYNRARRRAWFKDLIARLAGRTNRLLSFDAVKKSLRLGGPIYRGVKQVPVAQIVGSVDRYRDFDGEFLPAQDRTAGRWKSIARAFYDDVNLPPVRLYKVGEAYFVVDGHHRISVAREQGVQYVDAEVQEAVSRVPVSADLKSEDLKILHEYRRFLDRTHLDEIRPDQNLRFTIAGGYDQLIEHIATHRVYMELDEQREVSEAEAVAHWYAAVYWPVIESIRANHILADFPNRTEADLYLWIIEHLYYLREKALDVSVDEAAEDYADQFSERPIKKMLRGFKQAFGESAAAEEAEPDPGDLPPAVDPGWRQFMERTQLDRLRPAQNIRCSNEVNYGRLLEHIDRHRFFMGLDFKRDVSPAEAATHWYDEVYCPIVNAIAEHNVLDQFPGRTDSDLYLSIIDYLDYARKTENEDVSIDQAAVDYIGQFRQQPINNIISGLGQLFRGPTSAEVANPSSAAPIKNQKSEI